MFNVGDLIIYSIHGLSEIDDICEKNYGGITRMYYVLHPIDDPKLTINAPVDSDQIVMLAVMERDEATEILESFQKSGARWIEDARQRVKEYNSLVDTGNREEISKVVNTLMRKEQAFNITNQKMHDQDRNLLTNAQNILFKELAVSLDTSFEEITEKINSLISQES